jgi:hypothetical protein
MPLKNNHTDCQCVVFPCAHTLANFDKGLKMSADQGLPHFVIDSKTFQTSGEHMSEVMEVKVMSPG